MKVPHQEDWIGKLAILIIPSRSYVQISSEIPVEMVKEWQMEGVFVSANKPYLTVENSFRNSGILDKILFVDCASSIAGDNPSGRDRLVLIRSPANLTELTISITKSIDKINPGKKFLIFDSLTTMLIYSKLELLTRFAHSLGLMMKARQITCFFLTVEQEATKEMISFLSTIADEFVHVDINEGGETVVA